MVGGHEDLGRSKVCALRKKLAAADVEVAVAVAVGWKRHWVQCQCHFLLSLKKKKVWVLYGYLASVLY